MTSVLITGANRGLGLEFVRQYAAEGWRVFACCRDPERAEALAGIAAGAAAGVSVHRLDVGAFDQIDALARALADEAIDVLINNAGIYGAKPQDLDSLDYESWAETLRINCLAQVRVCQAFLEHVARSRRRIIVAISSKMGSIADNTTGRGYIYRTSKAALNAAMKSLAIDLAPRGVTVAVLHPGWVKTAMGGPDAPLGVEESVAGMRAVIAGLEPGRSGRFFGHDGAPIPW